MSMHALGLILTANVVITKNVGPTTLCILNVYFFKKFFYFV